MNLPGVFVLPEHTRSAGATAWDAVVELTCIVHLHTFLRSLQCPTPQPQGPSAGNAPAVRPSSVSSRTP